jgi:2-polyprenyl-3-methyl-5-hydroxy-6-metoxy-1,4-benzoquinol methylase
MKYDFQIDMSQETATTLILRNIHPGSHVLEFGPATGYMTRYLKEILKCTIYCVEIDSEAAEVSKQYCDKMLVADIESMTWLKYYEGELFDHIVFADVLEHLKNPGNTLRESLSLLKQDGTIVTSIPNIGHNAILMELMDGRFQYHSLGLLDDTHLRFFTRKSIFDLFKTVGISPIKLFATIAKPMDTEFIQDYSVFPWYLQTFLANRKDAHVYQFVFISKRTKDIAEEESFEDYSEVNDAELYLQVFWNDGTGFNEENSIKSPVIKNAQYNTYNLQIPAKFVSDLRLDPINFPSYIDINKIILVGPEQTAAYDIFCSQPAAVQIDRAENIITVNADQTYQFICTTNDPRIYIKGLPVCENGTTVMLQVMMKVGAEINEVALLENLIEKMKTKTIEDYLEIVKRDQHIVEQDRQIVKQNQEIAEIMASKSWRYTEPLRALTSKIRGCRQRLHSFMK